jgi:hypothetical protein
LRGRLHGRGGVFPGSAICRSFRCRRIGWQKIILKLQAWEHGSIKLPLSFAVLSVHVLFTAGEVYVSAIESPHRAGELRYLYKTDSAGGPAGHHL